MYLLDFRRGVVEEIDGRTASRGVPPRSGAASSEAQPEGKGYVFAVLGTPAREQDEE
jgi:hypothetical protein